MLKFKILVVNVDVFKLCKEKLSTQSLIQMPATCVEKSSHCIDAIVSKGFKVVQKKKSTFFFKNVSLNQKRRVFFCHFSRCYKLSVVALTGAARFLLVRDTKTGKNVPNAHKMDPMVIKYPKCL
jgi:hypothetical protein